MSDSNAYKILVIGNPGTVGKTSLLVRYVDDNFNYKTMITLGVDYKSKEIKSHQK